MRLPETKGSNYNSIDLCKFLMAVCVVAIHTHPLQNCSQDILNRAHNVRSEEEMYALVANLANGTMQ